MILKDRVLGCIFGQAVGDSLGISREFKSAFEIAAMSRAGDDLSDYVVTDRHVFGQREYFNKGDYSDDTDQALILLDSWLACDRRVDPLDIAKRLKHWLDTSGRGSGSTTRKVIRHEQFLTDPYTAAREVWEAAGKTSAPNGAVMRTSYVGLFYKNLGAGADDSFAFNYVSDCAQQAAQVTHYDHRCVASAVMVSVTVAALIRGYTVSSAIAEGQLRAQKYDGGIWSIIGPDITLNALRLDNGLPRAPGSPYPDIGFTYKALGAAIWALRALDSAMTHQKKAGPRTSFTNVLQAVIRAGGDTDTNAAVAGALMGALVGSEGLPPHLIAGLAAQQELQERAECLMDLP